MRFPFVKGHGTQNDFVVLPDFDGSVHGDLDPAVVTALCHRRRGIGADGVLRVMRAKPDSGSDWFMDYRNSDGSMAEMCGNGIRVFARYLARTGLIDTGSPLNVGTRAGVKRTTFADDGEISVDIGIAKVGEPVSVVVDGTPYDAVTVDAGNPHAVVFVDSLDDVGELRTAPEVPSEAFPDGVNVEFVMPGHNHSLSMRVYERGAGETRSCGTGACAAVMATVHRDAAEEAGSPLPSTYSVQVPGGVLTVSTDSDGRLHLKGPAVLVAEGIWTG